MQFSSLLAAFVFAATAATSLSARQGWTLPPTEPGVETLRDESGRQTRALRDQAATDASSNSALVANWQALGPFGGDIDDVQASPIDANIVLAGLAPASGSGGGMYRSTDAGASWTAVASLTLPVYDIAFAPDGTAYAGTIDGVWKSTTGGSSWVPLSLGIGVNDQVFDVDVDPSDPQRLWAGIADALGGQPINVMLSTNGGASWVNRTPPLAAPQSCYAIAIDPLNSNEVYAGFGGFGGGGQVWVSTNGGTGWVNRSAGLPARPVRDLVHDGVRVLVGGGQLFGGQTFGLFTSSDDGVTWTPLHDASWPNLVTQDIAIDPNDVNQILVGTAGRGVFRSTNGGLAWAFEIGGTGTLSVNAVSFSPGSSAVIYTGSSSAAVWKSVDGGASFASSSTGIGALDVFSIDSNPLDGNELAIAFQGLNDGGVFTSLDGGQTWSLASLPATRYSHVRFSPAGVLYAISSGPSTVGQEGLYRRNGASWTPLGPNQGTLFESDLTGLRVSANDPGLIVSVGADFGVAGFQPTVWITTNGGGTWTKTYEGSVDSHPLQDVWIVDPAADTTWVAAYVDYTGGQNGGVLRSTDSGVTWNPSNAGLPALMQAFSITGTPLGGGALYVSNDAAGNGVFRSVDGGASWTATGYVGAVREVQTDRTDPNVLYIAQNGAVRVRSSVNGGVTFMPFDMGLSGAGFPRDLQRATGAGTDLLYAGSTGSYSTDLSLPHTPFCFGDGTGAACPCGNASPVGAEAGCLNSLGSGATLVGSGSSRVASDSVVLAASAMPATTSVLFFQGTGQLGGGTGIAFGDGLRCVDGAVIRLGTKTASGGSAAYPGAGDPSISVRGLVPPAGGVRHYQAWYRNAAPFCTVATFNLTNGVTVTWAP